MLYPALRKGAKGQGTFTRVSWDEALDAIAERMLQIREQWGAEAILPFCYGGSNGLLTQDTNDAAMFRAFGTSRLARTVCAAPTGAANQGFVRQDARRHVRRLRSRAADHPLGRQPVGLRHPYRSVLEGSDESRRDARRHRSAPHVARQTGGLASCATAGHGPSARPRHSQLPVRARIRRHVVHQPTHARSGTAS